MNQIIDANLLKKLGLLFFRGLGILSRFLLTFLIAKKISLDFQGSFSLVNTSVTLLVLFFGLDFYIYSNKLLILNKTKSVFYLKNNLVFYSTVYVILIPILSIIFSFNDFEFSLSLLFFVVVLEHLGQEFFRIYIAIQRVYFANILLFIRSGLWTLVVVIYLFTSENINITINQLLLFWSVSALITVIISFYQYPNIKNFFKEKIDVQWIKNGLKVAMHMFLATILLKTIEFSDRYIIDFYYDKEQVGIYTFYYQLANLSNVIIFTLYISFLYPKLIDAIYKNENQKVKSIQKEIKVKSIIVIVLLFIMYGLILPFFLEYINRPQLYDYQLVLYSLLTSSLLLNLSYSGHYTLIGNNQEKKILSITFVCFILSLVLNFVLIKYIGIWGAIIAQMISNACMFALKNFESNKLARKI
ncbi:lipopolysaccharide biosynthesis protein [Aquimarina aggregata]|uniref:lipopolysaccharide biosynthesis protein n=1 Tax=Aquimarina aggregata TaxID=1642818 RepID=UPI0024932144|nr:polysaccharide biosynthesis C-terminal domain-containing protein [Aquimarina aggregata]